MKQQPKADQLIGYSSYYTLFTAEGEHGEDFKELADYMIKNETDIYWAFLKMATYGVICGKQLERKRHNKRG